MKRYYLIAAIFCCFFGSLFSQTVSAKLAIEWQKEKHPFLGWRNHEIPYLTVTYKNDMEYPIYFFNGKRDWEYPEVGLGSLINIRLSSSELAYFYGNYKEEKFIVKMDDPYFEIFPIENAWDSIYALGVINNNIFYIHAAIEEKQKKRKYPLDTTFKAMLVDEDKIQNAYRDYFLFLKPGETHTNRFNLAAFQMVGGEFVFIPINDSIENEKRYNIEWWKCDPEKKELPEKVGDYYLYEGKLVSTDSVKVKFDGIPRDEKKVKKLSKEAEKRRARDMKRWK